MCSVKADFAGVVEELGKLLVGGLMRSMCLVKAEFVVAVR